MVGPALLVGLPLVAFVVAVAVGEHRRLSRKAHQFRQLEHEGLDDPLGRRSHPEVVGSTGRIRLEDGSEVPEFRLLLAELRALRSYQSLMALPSFPEVFPGESFCRLPKPDSPPTPPSGTTPPRRRFVTRWSGASSSTSRTRSCCQGCAAF